MTYHVPSTTERRPRSEEEKLSDGATLSPPKTGWDEATARACGFVPVVNTTRPDDTATTTFDRSLNTSGASIVNNIATGSVSEVWTSRPKTPEELAADDAQANATTIDAAITAALAELQQIVDFPAVATVPAGTLTTAQLSNIAREMRTAVQQNRTGAQRVAATLKQTIRLVRGDFDGIN